MTLLTKKQALEVLNQILELYPDATTELVYDTPFHLLCAVIMSAQTTDKQVNKVTPKFNQRFLTPEDLAKATPKEVEKYISSIGLYHTKAKNLVGMAQLLVNNFNSEIPNDQDKLLTLPGVGQKTANVIRAEIYHVPAIAVDTHVSRISKVFKIVKEDATPDQVEHKLEAILPKEDWVRAHHAMIMFGRYTMTARAKNDPYSYLPSKKA